MWMQAVVKFYQATLLFLPVAVCVTQCGCLAIYTRKPVSVLVLDAETDHPIEGATVRVRYSPVGIDLSWPFMVNRPENERRSTDNEGRTEIRVADFAWITWRVGASGYLESSARSTDGNRVPIAYHPDTEKIRGRRATIRLYREPRARITVVVPDGYRGPLLIEKRASNRWLQGDVNQREFVFPANERGYVDIDATPLLAGYRYSFIGLPEPPIRARHTSGADIPREDWRIGDDDVALRWMDCVGPERQIFAVGTKADEDRLHPIIYHYDDGDPRSVTYDHEAIDQLFSEARGDARVSARYADAGPR